MAMALISTIMSVSSTFGLKARVYEEISRINNGIKVKTWWL